MADIGGVTNQNPQQGVWPTIPGRAEILASLDLYSLYLAAHKPAIGSLHVDGACQHVDHDHMHSAFHAHNFGPRWQACMQTSIHCDPVLYICN